MKTNNRINFKIEISLLGHMYYMSLWLDRVIFPMLYKAGDICHCCVLEKDTFAKLWHSL